jgi:hypothetical protein
MNRTQGSDSRIGLKDQTQGLDSRIRLKDKKIKTSYKNKNQKQKKGIDS